MQIQGYWAGEDESSLPGAPSSISALERTAALVSTIMGPCDEHSSVGHPQKSHARLSRAAEGGAGRPRLACLCSETRLVRTTLDMLPRGKQS